MDYEKKYKEALELAQKLYQDCPNGKNDRLYYTTDLEKIFPELRESEDERIKKEIISFIQDDIDEINLKVSGDYDDRDEDDIAHQNWCKKAISWLEKQEGCEYIKKDWLEHIKQSWYKEGFIDGKYSGGTSKEWTINDVAIFKEIIDFLENGTAKLQHDLTKYANWLKTQFTRKV